MKGWLYSLRWSKDPTLERNYDSTWGDRLEQKDRWNMPLLTRWMIKTSLVYLLLALLVGLLQVTGQLHFIEPVRVHLLVVGWITLLIFGVALWMFPKYTREKPRGSEQLGWLSYGLLNAGLILRVIGESVTSPGKSFGWVLVASAVLQLLAGLAFFANTWPRIKEK